MKYGIYRKVDNKETLIAYATSLEYQGDWMTSRYVQVDVKSPSELHFAVGDYLKYRGETFELKNLVGIKKQAVENTYGEAFTYSGIKFESLIDELSATLLLNYTRNKDTQVLSGTLLSEFSIHCVDVTDFVDLIQANMDRAFNQGLITAEWSFVVDNIGTGIGQIQGNTDVTVDISNITCLEALKLIYDDFGVSYKIRKSARIIEVGAADGRGTFCFGKGNGLRDITRSIDTDYELITRLRVVGNTTNMPRHYYYYLGIKPGGYTIKGALLYSEGGGTTKTYQTYRISAAGTFFFNLPYGVKVNTSTTLPIKINGKSCTATYWGTADDYKLTTIDDEVKQLIDSTFETIEAGGTPTAGLFNFEIDDDYISSCPAGKKVWKLSGDANLLPLANLMPTTYDVYNSSTGSVDTKKTYNSDGSDFVLDPYFDSANIAQYGIREAWIAFTSDDDEKGIEDIYPTIENETNTVSVGSTYTNGSEITDDGIFDSGETVSGFKVTINDIGFNLNNTKSESVSNYGTLCMKTGLLGGREFDINSVAYNTIDGTQVLTCSRIEDDDTDTYIPNKNWKINAGDEFVITDIEMPDSYVETAGTLLANSAREYLSKYDHPHYVYSVTMDNIYLQRQNDECVTAKTQATDSIYYNIKEGDYLTLTDDDLIEDSETISIDKLTIKESEGKIPQVSVTLRNEKKENTIVRITRNVNSVAQTANTAYATAKRRVTASQIQQIINSSESGSSGGSGGSGSGSNVSYTPTQTEGNELGTITIDEIPQKIYSPKEADGLTETGIEAISNKFIRKDKNDATTHSISFQDSSDENKYISISSSRISCSNDDDSFYISPTQLVMDDSNGHDIIIKPTQISVSDDDDNISYIREGSVETGTVKTTDLTATGATTVNTLTANGKAEFKSQVQFDDTVNSKDFVHGIMAGGHGYKIDADGNAEMESLILRSFLEVPELRYNRVTVESGVTWNAPGAGVIKYVDTTNKRIYLKLEEGEIGSFVANDICMGIWHFTDEKYSTFNDDKDAEEADTSGLTVSGFCKVYFKVISVVDYYLDSDTDTIILASAYNALTDDEKEKYTKYTNGAFTYSIRNSLDSSWTITAPPMKAMTIVAYGNFTNTSRQKSFYSTRTFSRYLAGVNTWEIGSSNIMMQLGDCSGLTVGGVEMDAYSAYLSNVYFSGKIKELEDNVQINYRGEFDTSATYKKNDEVLYDSALWIYNMDWEWDASVDGYPTTTKGYWSKVSMGDAMSIKTNEVTYAVEDDGTTVPSDNDFIYSTYNAALTNAKQGQYIWSKTYVVYSDNTPTTTYGVSYISKNGYTPYIGTNGNWWINGGDTGVSANATNIGISVACSDGTSTHADESYILINGVKQTTGAYYTYTWDDDDETYVRSSVKSGTLPTAQRGMALFIVNADAMKLVEVNYYDTYGVDSTAITNAQINRLVLWAKGTTQWYLNNTTYSIIMICLSLEGGSCNDTMRTWFASLGGLSSGTYTSSYKRHYFVTNLRGTVGAGQAYEEISNDSTQKLVTFNVNMGVGVVLNGEKGADGVTTTITKTETDVISTIEVYYYLSSSSSTQTGDTWSTDKPVWTNGNYIWYKYHYIYASGATKDSEPQLLQNQKIRVRGTWVSGVTYYNNNEFMDIVIQGGSYYTPKTSSLTQTTWNASSWSTFSEFENLATSVLLANQGYVDCLDSGHIRVGQTTDHTSATIGQNSSDGGYWDMSAGAITHTKTGLTLTSDGNLYINEGKLSLKVGDDSQTIEKYVAENAGNDDRIVNDNLLLNPLLNKGFYTALTTSPSAATGTANYSQKTISVDSVTYNQLSEYDDRLYSIRLAYSTTDTWVSGYFADYYKPAQRVKLKADTDYTFSVWVKSNITIQTSYPVAQFSLWKNGTTTDTSTSGRIYIGVYAVNKGETLDGYTQYYFTFNTATITFNKTAANNAYLYFSWMPFFSFKTTSSLTSAHMIWAAAKLEEGTIPTTIFPSTEKKLLSTGIDIENKKITLTTDQFEIQNNSGVTNVWVDASGNLTTRGITANLVQEIDTANHLNEDLLIRNDTLIYGSTTTTVGENDNAGLNPYYYHLDVLRCGNTLKITYVDHPVVIPYYIADDSYTRTATRFGKDGTVHMIKQEELLQLVGKKITLILSDTAGTNRIYTGSQVTGANDLNSVNIINGVYKITEFTYNSTGIQLNAAGIYQLEFCYGNYNNSLAYYWKYANINWENIGWN